MKLYRIKNLVFLALFSLVLLDNETRNVQSKVNESNEPTIDYLKNYEKSNEYILGPGDEIALKFSNETPELNGIYLISADGKVYIERLDEIYVEGLTVNELQKILQKEFEKYLYNPQLFIKVINYRPIRVYISGEVNTPGLYLISGKNNRLKDVPPDVESYQANSNEFLGKKEERLVPKNVFPTVFDAIREAKGITAYSNLKEIKVTRKNPISNGGGRVATKINFLDLLENGQFQNNIRVYDEDTIYIPKSSSTTIEQLSKAIKTNLNDQYINVFVTGRVNNGGITKVSQGATLSDAIIIAGGVKVLKGRVLFLRYDKDGQIVKRQFRYRLNAKKGSQNNPYLKEGDVIYVKDNIFISSSEVITEVTRPLQGLFSVYGIYKAIEDD